MRYRAVAPPRRSRRVALAAAQSSRRRRVRRVDVTLSVELQQEGTIRLWLVAVMEWL